MLEIGPMLPESGPKRIVPEFTQHACLRDRIIWLPFQQRFQPTLHDVDAISGKQEQPV
jgi:hypothetical protein